MNEINKKIIAMKLIVIFLVSLISVDFGVEGDLTYDKLYFDFLGDRCRFGKEKPLGNIAKDIDFSEFPLEQVNWDTDSKLIGPSANGIFTVGQDWWFNLKMNRRDKEKILGYLEKRCNIKRDKLESLFGALDGDPIFDQSSFITSNSEIIIKGGNIELKDLELQKDLSSSLFGKDEKNPFKIGENSVITSFKDGELKLKNGAFVTIGESNQKIKVDDFITKFSKEGTSLDTMSFITETKDRFDLFGQDIVLNGKGKIVANTEGNIMKSIVLEKVDKPLEIKEFGSLKNLVVEKGSFEAIIDEEVNVISPIKDSIIKFKDEFSKGVEVKLDSLIELDKFDIKIPRDSLVYAKEDGLLRFGQGERNILVNNKEMLVTAKDPNTIFLGQSQQVGDLPYVKFDNQGSKLFASNVKDISFSYPGDQFENTIFTIDKNGKFLADIKSGESPINSVIVNREEWYQNGDGWSNKPGSVVTASTREAAETIATTRAAAAKPAVLQTQPFSTSRPAIADTRPSTRPAVPETQPSPTSRPATDIQPSPTSRPAGEETQPTSEEEPKEGEKEESSLTTLLVVGGFVGAIGLVIAYNNKDKDKDKDKDKKDEQRTVTRTGSRYG